jgi:hypothetical protein
MVDDRLYLTGVLVLVAVVLAVWLLYWFYTVVCWKWNQYIASRVSEQLVSDPNESSPQPPPSTARHNRSVGNGRVVLPRTARKQYNPQ